MRLLICKDSEQNTLLETRLLKETDNIKYSIIENPPTIEISETQYGYYALDDEGNLIVKYEDYPKSEVDVLREENANLHERLCYVQEVDAENVLMINDLQLLVEELQAQITEINNNSGKNIEE